MKKIVFLFIVLTFGFSLFSSAQYVLQPLVSPSGAIQKDQLWNITLINSSSYTGIARISISLQDRSTGNVVMSGTTSSFSIVKGVNSINALRGAPLQYTQSGNFSTFVPVGNYLCCYILSVANTDQFIPVAEECIQVNAEPLAPPVLISLSDSTEQEQNNVQFLWQSPAPLSMFSQLSYDLVVSEVLPNQTGSFAVQNNLPFYSKSLLSTTVHNYTDASRTFKRNQWYAWQILAKDRGRVVGVSEVWNFRIRPPQKALEALEQTSYLKINEPSTSVSLAHDGLLKIHFSNVKGSDTALHVTIFPSKESDFKTPIEFFQPIVYGDNYIILDLFQMGRRYFREGVIYVLELRTHSKKLLPISFEVRLY